jgi:archaellum component FlaC
MFKKRSARLAGTETAPVIGADSARVVDGSDSASAVSANDRAPVPGEGTKFEAGGLPVGNNEQSQNAVAVEKIFASTKQFEDRFGKLLPAFEQVGNLGDEAVTAFESVKTLANHLEMLTSAFEPLKSLQDQLARVASSFDPVSSLQGQFAEVSNAFRDHLKHLIGALQPAKDFHPRLVALAATFESAGELQQRFERLAAALVQSPRAIPSSTEKETVAVNGTAALPTQSASPTVA